MRAKHPEEYEWDLPALLLAQMVDGINWLVWSKTKDGRRGRNMPEPIPRPGVKPRKKQVKGKALPLDQFKKKLDEMRARVRSSTAQEEVTRTSVRRERDHHGS